MPARKRTHGHQGDMCCSVRSGQLVKNCQKETEFPLEFPSQHTVVRDHDRSVILVFAKTFHHVTQRCHPWRCVLPRLASSTMRNVRANRGIHRPPLRRDRRRFRTLELFEKEKEPDRPIRSWELYPRKYMRYYEI